MIMSWLFDRSKRQRSVVDAPPRIIEHETCPHLIYAIGDIHGCYDKFCRLEERIFADAEQHGGDALVVVLGDFIDRGPELSRVIDRLLTEPPDGTQRMCLSGNHEATMIDFSRRPRLDHLWLRFGGVETLLSYGVNAVSWMSERPNAALMRHQLDANIPTEHIDFTSGLPYLIRFKDVLFVHAGIDRNKPLSLQIERELLWIRPNPGEEDVQADGLLVVHGHTPVREPFVSSYRVNLDTGAFAGGALSAGRFVNGRFDALISSDG